ERGTAAGGRTEHALDELCRGVQVIPWCAGGNGPDRREQLDRFRAPADHAERSLRDRDLEAWRVIPRGARCLVASFPRWIQHDALAVAALRDRKDSGAGHVLANERDRRGSVWAG